MDTKALFRSMLVGMIALAVCLAALPTTEAQTDSEAANKALAERFITEILPPDGDVDLVDELYADDFVFHFVAGDDMDRAAFKAFWAGNHASLPDLVVDDDYVIVAQGDMVAAWWYMGGTFENEWAGIPPTGEPWGINVLDLWRFEDGKIVEAWDNFDTMNFMQQLGAVPAEEPVGPQASWHLELGESDLTREEIFELTMTHGQAVDESDVEALDVTFSPDMVFHSPMVGETDLDGLRAEVTGITTFLGDPVTVLEPEFFVTEGDLMFVFYEMGGSFEGEFLGIPPNGNPLMFAGVNVYRYGDKQAEEFWYMFDTLGLFGQMTVEPAE